mgnify:CR=1 FL=1
MQSLKSNVVVSLMVIHLMLANSHFDTLQILLEIVLIALFLAGLSRVKFKIQELLLVCVYLVVVLVSFFINELNTVLLAGKVMGLGILSMLYFSKYQVESHVLAVVFLVNCLLVITWAFTGINLVQSLADQAGGSWEGLAGRPLGLFMSAHVSAYFSAIFLIFYFHRVRSYGLGLVLIWASTSFFTLIAYSAQIIITYGARYARLFLYCVLSVICFVFILGLIQVSGDGATVVEIFLAPFRGVIAPDRLMGVGVIFNQVFNLEVYSRVFTIFPSDYQRLLENWTDRFGNEVMFFTYMQHAGLLLLVCYLWVLMSRIRYFLIFALVGLLHYGDVTSPLFVYMMVTYSRLLQNREGILMANSKNGSQQNLKPVMST